MSEVDLMDMDPQYKPLTRIWPKIIYPKRVFSNIFENVFHRTLVFKKTEASSQSNQKKKEKRKKEKKNQCCLA